MKQFTVAKPIRSSRAETAVFASLAVAGLISVVLAAVSMTDFVRGKDQIVAALSNPTPRGIDRLPVIHYVRSGQLVADLRTMVALARYVLTPEPSHTNCDYPVGQNPVRAIPGFTNYFNSSAPKA